MRAAAHAELMMLKDGEYVGEDEEEDDDEATSKDGKDEEKGDGDAKGMKVRHSIFRSCSPLIVVPWPNNN